MKVTATVNSLMQKHNFVKNTIEYSVELIVLGAKVVVPVSEDFVQRLDAEAERSSKQESRAQALRNRINKTRQKEEDEFNYNLANVDENDYETSDDNEYEQV